MKMKKLALTTAAVLVAVGCASTPKKTKTKSVSVEVDRMMPSNENLASSAVEVILLLDNPRPEAIQLKGVTYSIDTGEEVAGTLEGEVESDATVEPGQSTEISFKQIIPFPEEEGTYRAILEEGTVPITLEGEVELADGSTADFSRSSEVATPLLPKFVVHDAQAARYGEGGLDVTWFLRLINENVFPILIQGVKYTVYIGDKEIKSEQAALGERLLAGSAEEYEVSSVLDESSWSKEDLDQIMSDRRFTYRVEATVELTRITLPFEHTGDIELATGE